MEMQELGFRICFYKCRMPVIIGEERNFAVVLQHFFKKAGFKFKDGALVGYGMGMGNRAFITGFGNQHATAIGIERPPENIEQEIALSHKAYTKFGVVFRLRRAAFSAPAPEIHNTVEI